MARKSQYSRDKKEGKLAFHPNLEEWSKVCTFAVYDVQIAKYFSITTETLYAFIDKERCKEESGEKSDYLDAYINRRKETKEKIAAAFLNKIDLSDTGSILFGMESYNGVIKQKDIEHIELKKQQLRLKSREFLTNLADKFKLDHIELKAFADKYFKDIDMERG